MTEFFSRFRIAAKLWLGYSVVAAILTALIQLGFGSNFTILLPC